MRLAHYTSIDTLALILDSEKIRFTRLDCLDDFNEVNIYPSYAHKLFFVSCWSDPKNEIISQWAMYGGNKRGVAILLDSEYIGIPESYSEPIELKDKSFATLFIYETSSMSKPFKIKYLDNVALKNYAEGCLNISENGNVAINATLGMFKSEDWSFQNENRYIIQVFQLKDNAPISNEDIIYENSFVDIPLNKGFNKNIQIIIGPLCSPAEILIIKALTEKYNLSDPIDSFYKNVLLK